MTLQSSGAISLSQIAGEFGGKNPLELGEYRGQDNAPTTGAISFSNFYGTDGIPPSGLQYHYDGQISEHNDPSAGNVQDLGSSNYTGTLTNGAAYNSGNFGKVVFDGVDDYVRVTGYKGITGKTARTSIVFMKLDAATPSATARALSWGDTSTGGKWGMEFTPSGNFSLGASGGSRQSDFAFTLNQWGMFSATIPSGVSGTAGVGQQVFTSSSNFTVPAGVYSISAVCIGGGGGGGDATRDDEPGAGGGGGALSYGTFAVTPGETLTITVGSGGQNGGTGGTGGTSSIDRGGPDLLAADGGGGGSSTDGGASGGGGGGSSGGTERDGGGSGGNGGSTSDSTTGAGGGAGAGGYGGNGGEGADRGTTNATAGSGGGGGGGGSGSSTRGGAGGGGVGLLGQGSNGAAGSGSTGGGGGSGGNNGSSSTSSVGANGGSYGGGGGGGRDDNNGGDGQPGAVRLIWGPGRSYPSTNVGDATPVTGSNTSGFLSDVTLYYNATKLVNYSTGSVEVNTASSADVTWGGSLADTALSPIDGEIAKVLVYNRELTHAEITQIYNAKAVALGLAQLSATTEGSGSPIDPTYSVSPSTTSLNEGSSVTFTVTTSNIPSGTTLYWTLNTISGTVNANDFTGGSSGSFTITSNSGSVVLTLANDVTTEGSESFQFEVRTGSTGGTLVATSSTVTIGDTSVGAATERAVFAGGHIGNGTFTSNMQYINIASTGNAISYGSLSQSKYLLAACSSSTRGVWAGGWTGSPTNAMHYKDLSSNGNTTTFGSLTQSKDSLSGCGNATLGMFHGGDTGNYTDRIDRITIATTGNAADHGNLQQAKGYVASCSSPTRAISFGGFSSSNVTVSQIDYHAISTTPGNAANFGSLITARDSAGACSSSTRGLCFIGENSSGNSLSSIEYITIATTGNAQSFGTSNYTSSYPAAVAGSTRGVYAGGMTDLAGANRVTNISYVTMATTGNATSFGVLTSARGGSAGCSDSHGGL